MASSRRRTLALKYGLIALASTIGLLTYHAVASSPTEVLRALYPKGLLWRHGQLYFGETEGTGVKIWDGQKIRDFWRNENHCGVTSLVEFGKGHLLFPCYYQNFIMELDENGKEVRKIDRDSSGKPFVGPNVFTTDGHGGFYLSASGVYKLDAPITGAVFHISQDGNKIVEVASSIHYSNGLTLTKDGKTLLVAEMFANRVLSFPIQADGSLGVRSVWVRLQDLVPSPADADGYLGPDGIKLGPDGNYYITQNGSGRVLVVDESKKLLRVLKAKTKYTTDVGFGPAGSGDVYITGAFEEWKAPYPGAIYLWKR